MDERVREVREVEVIDEGEVKDVSAGGMLAALNKSEIDIQIATARRWPRSIQAFKEEALALATLDEETAGSMFYALKRGGKTVEGPSVRLAEIVGSCWGHTRYGSRVVEIDAKFVTAQGMAFDLQKNVAAAVEVKRRITDSKGMRYSDDMIAVTANAAMSIALRNAMFKVVPFALVKPIYEAAKAASIGKALTMAQRRERALEWFEKKCHAAPADVLRVLGVKGVEDLTVEHLVTLQGFRTAITDGETTWDTITRDAQAAEERQPTVVRPASLTLDGALRGKARGEDDAHGKPVETVGKPPAKAEGRTTAPAQDATQTKPVAAAGGGDDVPEF